MKVLVIEQPQWSSKKETEMALKYFRNINLAFSDFGQAMSSLFDFKPDVCAIDSCFGPDRQISTAPIINSIKKIFKGKLIAISNIAYTRFPLVRAGCQFECAKGRLPEILIKIANQAN